MKYLKFIVLVFVTAVFLSGCATGRPPMPQNGANGKFDHIFAEIARKGGTSPQAKEEQAPNQPAKDIPHDPFAETQVQPMSEENIGESRPYVAPTTPGKIEYEPAKTGSVQERVSEVEAYVRSVGGRTARVNFAIGSSNLDQKAVSVLEGLKGLQNEYRAVLLTGFSSRGRNPDLDKDLSFARTETVGDKLNRIGFDLSRAEMIHGGPTNKFGNRPEDNQVVVIVLQRK